MAGTAPLTTMRGTGDGLAFGATSEPAPIRLMVVDAHPIVRWALTQIAADQPDLVTVGEAADAAEAMNLAFAVKPDVVTIDSSLPDGQGWLLARKLREQYPDMGIVILSGEGSDEALLRALDSGASAFVSKSAPIREVVSAIRHAAMASSAFSAAGLSAALRRRRETSERMSLSPREHQILLLLHDGLSVPEIAAQLFVSLSTAKTYVARLYEKLGARNRAQALMTAVRLGMFENHHQMAAAAV
jgi:DNA-binding NarL/FixJ family response regulator